MIATLLEVSDGWRCRFVFDGSQCESWSPTRAGALAIFQAITGVRL